MPDTTFSKLPVGRPVLQIQHVVAGSRHTLVLSGQLDLSSTTELEAALFAVCADSARGIVIDLRKLTFIDSTGVRTLLRAVALCKKVGDEFSVIPGPEHILQVFEVTGLKDVLPFQTESPDC